MNSCFTLPFYFVHRSASEKQAQSVTSCAIRTGSGAGAPWLMLPLPGKQFWSDYEIVVDKEGVPHFTGMQPHLMKEYRRRGLFAFGSLGG